MCRNPRLGWDISIKVMKFEGMKRLVGHSYDAQKSAFVGPSEGAQGPNTVLFIYLSQYVYYLLNALSNI